MAIGKMPRPACFLVILLLAFSFFTTAFAASVDYQYDDFNRLRMERDEAGKTSIYEYDQVGNRTTAYTTLFTAITQSGAASPSGYLTVREGAPRTIYFTPIPHYHVMDVSVDGVSQGAIAEYRFADTIAPQNIQARFAIDRFYLGVSLLGSSYGRVRGSLPGIDCGGDCSEYYDYGTAITLTPTPSSDAYAFTGWSGACSGTGSCTLLMDAAKAVSGGFARKTFPIYTYSIYTPYCTEYPTDRNLGGGTISPVLPMVSYDGYQTFTITPSSGNKISNVRIDGEHQGAISSYTFFNVREPHVIVAQFYQGYGNSAPINLYLNDMNGGSVTSPSGLACGMGAASCSKTFDYYTYVKLVATSNVGYRIAGTNGAACFVAESTVQTSENGVPIYLFKCTAYVYATQNIYYTFLPLAVWPINANPVGAGSITPAARTYFNTGGSKTYTITPSSGAAIEDVRVDGVSVGPVASYTFSNISTHHHITATFSCPRLPVRVLRLSHYCYWYGCYSYYTYSYYATLQAAYDAAFGGETIQTVEGLAETFNANRPINVTVEGGYDCNYSSNQGRSTVIKGTVTATAGGVTFKNIIIF